MDASTVKKYMQAMAESLQSRKAKGLKITYQFDLTGEGGGTWTVAVAEGKCSVSQGATSRADTTITMSTDYYLKLAAGELNAMDAFNRGHIKVKGNTDYALKFTELFLPWASRVTSDEPPEPSPPTPAQPQPEPTSKEPTVADYVRAMPQGFRPDKASGLRAIFQFELTGEGDWTVTIADQTCTVSQGKSEKPAATIRMSGGDFIKLAQGKLNTTQAYSQGKVRISGDLNLAARIPDIFKSWADVVEGTPTPEPPPTPTPEPIPQPTPSGPVNPTLLNGSFDEFQPHTRDGEALYWIEPQFPERYGAHWTLVIISETERRSHLMDSEVFGKFTQKYFGGGGRDYHIHGKHSQVITSRSAFDVVFLQTVTAQPGREYTFKGSIVNFYRGTNPPPVHDKIFKTIGIDPTGGRDYTSSNVIWGERDGRDNEWRYPSIRAKAKGDAITVFIRLENTEYDVGRTDLNIIHLDDFRLE